MGLEAIWAGFSMLHSANTFSLRVTSSPEKVLKALEREAAALKHRRGLQLLSSALFVAMFMFFFFQTKAHLYLSLWDLAASFSSTRAFSCGLFFACSTFASSAENFRTILRQCDP